MIAMARPFLKTPAPLRMDAATRLILRKRFRLVLVVDVLCVLAAFGGIYAHVTLRQVWGMPLLVLAMIAGFGAQIAFIVGLVKAGRPEKGA
jgi:hypothetical protein